MMMEMGFKSLMSKIYSDQNQELEGSGTSNDQNLNFCLSFEPPTKQQAQM